MMGDYLLHNFIPTSKSALFWLRRIGIERVSKAYETALEPPLVYPAKLCFQLHWPRIRTDGRPPSFITGPPDMWN